MPLFLTQLHFELMKMFARKRTYIGFGAFLVLEMLILFLLNLPKPKFTFRHLIEQNGFGFDDYYSGTTLGLLIVLWTTTLLGSLYLALVASDLVAKEVEEGTMRMLLCRPISRLRVTLLKYISCIIYTFAFIGFISLTALLAGLAYRGYGGLMVFSPIDHLFVLHPAGPGLRLYLLSIPLLALSMTAISSLGFLFSCCNMKPAAAAIVTLSVIFLDFVIHGIPYFESLKVWFITAHLSTWLHIFETYPPGWLMIQDYSYLLSLDLTCFILGSAIFLQRDLK
jgi:ABC-2 type transport system permease protein